MLMLCTNTILSFVLHWKKMKNLYLKPAPNVYFREWEIVKARCSKTGLFSTDLYIHDLRLKPLWILGIWSLFRVLILGKSHNRAELGGKLLCLSAGEPGLHGVTSSWHEQRDQLRISHSSQIQLILIVFSCFWKQVCWGCQLFYWALPVPPLPRSLFLFVSV